MTAPVGDRGSGGLWLRWSWRDLRRHAVAVVVIAVVMAIGIGVYVGLGSTSTWRRQSNDASFAVLQMHDVQLSLSPGTFAAQGQLVDLVSATDPTAVVAAEERLVVDSQLDASDEARSVLVEARIVGMSSAAEVDALWVRDGDPFTPAGTDAVLEAKFADHRDLPERGTVTVAGGTPVDYVGLGVIPEDFFYEGPAGSVLSAGELAPLYLPLDAAQELLGRPGQVNDLVIRLGDGADVELVAEQLSTAAALRGLSATITLREDESAIRVLYDDIDNDQQFWNILAGLVLVAAGLATFNLVSRIVEAQRREIGIGMALGVARWKLAIRPLLVGVQVGVLAVIVGVGMGLLVGSAMAGLMETFLPLPEYLTPFQFGLFARGAALGLIIPIVASAIPVMRAVRVEPIEAIRTGHLVARSSRFTDLTRRLPLPGSSLSHMPVRNFLRTPRRAVLTAIGVGAAIATLIAVFGMLDSFARTIDATGDELTQDDPERVVVQLDTFYEVDAEELAAIGAQPAVGAVDAGLRLPVTALGDEEIDALLEVVDFDSAGWTPTIERSTGSDRSGLVLAEKAMDDLGVDLGDPLRVRHPTRQADGSFALVESEITVSAVHASPLRTFAFADVELGADFGFGGAANVVNASPAPGYDRDDVQRAVLGLPAVGSSQAVARVSESFDSALDQFVGFLVITAAAVLVLALLIAFNATRIAVEERRREHATMRAFGLPVRSIIGTVVKESVLVGVLATIIGIGVGTLFLELMLRSLASTTLPDLAIDRILSWPTLGIAAAVGILAVALAPLFLARRVRRMDVPDALRIME